MRRLFYFQETASAFASEERVWYPRARMPRAANLRPLYREIVRDALRLAWSEKRLWPFALLAGFIQLGGIYDTLLLRLRSFAERTVEISNPTLPVLWQQIQSRLFLDKLEIAQSLALFGILMAAVCVLSLIAQGVLVFGLEARANRSKTSLRELLREAAHRFIPLLAVNIVGVGAIWLVGFFTAIPLIKSVAHPSVLNVFSYLVLFTFLIVTTVIFTSWHMLALNGLLVDQLNFTEAFTHAWRMMKHAWLTVFETALLLVVTSMALYLVILLTGLLVNVPALLLLLATVLLAMPKAYLFLRLFISATFLALLALAGLYTITFQYATWNRLYRRINEGTAHAKLHRLTHWVNKHLSARPPRA